MYKKLAICFIVLAVAVALSAKPALAVPPRVNFVPNEITIVEGETTTIDIELNEPIISDDPDQDFVSIDLSSNHPDKLTFDASPVVFESDEWSQTKSFNITAIDDGLLEGDVEVTVSGTVESGSEYYDGFVASMTVIITDDEAGQDEDLNGDNVPDINQPHVGGYTSIISGKTVAMDVGEDCELTTDDIGQEKHLDIQDTSYDYANGLFDIEGDCGSPGFTTTIKLYYYDVDPDGMVFRKFNPNTNKYSTVESAVISEEIIDGHNVAVVTYQLTDGGELDTDGLVDGQFADPAGLASVVTDEANITATLADTGSSVIATQIAASFLFLGSGFTFFAYKKRKI